MTENVSQDFVFGTLATDDLRWHTCAPHDQALSHAHQLEPLDPCQASQ